MTVPSPRQTFGDLLRRVLAPLYEVSLIDRLTGRPYAVAGIPLVIVTCDPRVTKAQMMHHRDAQRWGAAVRPINRQGVL